MKVLLIEDELDDQKTYKRLIEDACSGGAEVHTARDSLCVDEKLGKITPDLVVVDIWLGGMTQGAHGIEIIEQMRKKSEYKKLKIFALTVAVSDKVKDKATNAGCDKFFRKMEDDKKFINAVRRFHSTFQRKQLSTVKPNKSPNYPVSRGRKQG